MFTGLAISLAFRAGLFNIGAPGQMTFGAFFCAVAAAALPGINGAVHIALALAAGCAAGGVWGWLSGVLKTRYGVHEVLSTIMLNYIAADLTTYLASHNFKDPSYQAPQTRAIASSTHLHSIAAGSSLNAGFYLAIFFLALVTWAVRNTSFGFQIRAVGQNEEAARASGMPVDRVVMASMSLSGGLAGIAGAVLVLGQQHCFVAGIAGNYGFDGIAVALLGGASGTGILLSALFFGALAHGAEYMQIITNVPNSIALIVQAMVILLAGVRTWRKKRVRLAGQSNKSNSDKNDGAYSTQISSGEEVG